MEQCVVNITYQLKGEIAAQFLLLKDEECIENNAELARSLALKQMRHELKQKNLLTIKPKKKSESA